MPRCLLLLNIAACEHVISHSPLIWLLPFPPSLPVFRDLVIGWQMGEILADVQKVEEGRLGRVALGYGHLGRTAISGER